MSGVGELQILCITLELLTLIQATEELEQWWQSG